MKHTPLPWKYSPHAQAFVGQDGLIIGDTTCGVHAVREANAEFIVKAVNAFYPLVEVAERYEALLRQRGCVDGDSKLDFVTAALSLAKGEKA